MKTDRFKYIYLLGIGGIGMSALARYFHAQGKSVAGYDKYPSSLTHSMEADGISIHYSDEVAQIPQNLKDLSKEDVLVIYTPAVPSSHSELNWFRENHYTLEKRAVVLGWITLGKKCIAIAGTHGKTSTTTITAHLLIQSGIPCTAFMGGVSINYNTNLLLNPEAETVVVEADEYDRSFLHLHPNVAVITAMDADHLDIYGTADEVTRSFVQFAGKTASDGVVLLKKGLRADNIRAATKTYSESGEADFYASNISVSEGAFHFDLNTPEGSITDINFAIPGRHNIQNAVAASAAAISAGVSLSSLKTALESYRGVRRRMEFHVRNDQHILVDDYAHHPEEIRAAVSAIKELYPDKKVTGIFQPHLFSRTRDFMDAFRESLGLLDNCWLMDIYPAREEPIPGITSQILAEGIPGAVVLTRDELLSKVSNEKPELLITMGAGDISAIVEPLKERLLA